MANLSKTGNTRAFLELLASRLPCLVLTGAGISVSAGIPTYRDSKGQWLRSDPIKHQEFINDSEQRQKYWGRSLLGWPAVRDAQPGRAHQLLADLEQVGMIEHLVTQNVDRLHQRAGSKSVTDLHGRLDKVNCLACGDRSSREAMQQRLSVANPHINRQTVDARPDGDADMPRDLVRSISIPCCELCGGTLMPEVIFFGGSIPKARVDSCKDALTRSRSLLVVGSSLQVYSGFRFCRWAQELELPILLINPGVTRADSLGLRWHAEADAALTEVCNHVRIPHGTQPIREGNGKLADSELSESLELH
ncbi:MAG: NAD-dependent protein deacetylase [Pseudomonadota bacterium]